MIFFQVFFSFPSNIFSLEVEKRGIVFFSFKTSLETAVVRIAKVFIVVVENKSRRHRCQSQNICKIFFFFFTSHTKTFLQLFNRPFLPTTRQKVVSAAAEIEVNKSLFRSSTFLLRSVPMSN